MEPENFERSLRSFVCRRSFVPFVVRFVDESTITIEHPDVLVLRGDGVVVYLSGNEEPTVFDYSEVRSITEVGDDSLDRLTLRGLTYQETEVVGRCIRAAAEGSFFPDCEFQTIFGLWREEVAAVADKWPHLDYEEEQVQLAINNSVNNLLGYPHRKPEEFEEYVGEPEEEVERIFSKWRKSR